MDKWNDTVWVAARQGGILEITGGIISFPFSEFYSHVSAIAGEDENHFWAGTGGGGLCRYEDGQGTWYETLCGTTEPAYITDIEYLGPDDVYFAGGYLDPNKPGFLCHYDGNTFQRVRDFLRRVTTMRITRPDRMWVGIYGVEGGIALSYRFDGRSWTVHPLWDWIKDLDFVDFNTPYAVPDMADFYGFRNGAWELLPGISGLGAYNGLQHVKVVSDQEIYVSTGRGVMLLYDGNISHEVYVPSFFERGFSGNSPFLYKNQNDVWYATYFGLSHFNGQEWKENALFPYLNTLNSNCIFGFPNGKILLGGSFGTIVLANPYTPTPTTPTPTPTITPTSLPTLTPTGTPPNPTPSETPAPAPFILLAGYWDSRLASTSGGTVDVVALSPGVGSVEFAAGGVPSGVDLPRYGAPEDGVFWLQDGPFPAGVPSFRYLLELQAVLPGASSTLWPYLTVGS